MNFEKARNKTERFFARIFGRQDASNQKKQDNPDFVGAYATGLGVNRGNQRIAEASRYPEDEQDIKSSFEDYITRKGKLLNQEENNWRLFAIESISYSVLVLVIGIIGGNLENISNLTDPHNKGNSYLLRNKFEGLFKHSLSANSQLKIDESVYKDKSIPIDLRVWCSLCDLGVQAKLLLQSWPLKIFDYGNWAMCELTWNAFDNFFTKGKAFKAYFIPILLIIIIYFQIPLIIGFLVALLGSAQHPNFPLYWLGVFAYLSYIKSIVRPMFKFILGGSCTKLLAKPDITYIDQRIVDSPMTINEILLLDSLDERVDDPGIRYSKRRAIGKLLEIIKSTPCTFDTAYEKSGKETTIKNANCIDMNIDYSIDSGSDSDIRSFKDLVANLISGDSFLYLVAQDQEVKTLINDTLGTSATASDNDLFSVIGDDGNDRWDSYKQGRDDILSRRYASRRRKDKFKYFVNPLCVADVVYIDSEFREREGSPLWEADVKYWLWSKTKQSDRKRMYDKLRDEIDNDTYGYFKNLDTQIQGKKKEGRKIAKRIIDLVESKDNEWHEAAVGASAFTTRPTNVGQYSNIQGLFRTTHDYEMAAGTRSSNITNSDHTLWTSGATKEERDNGNNGDKRRDAKANAETEINNRAARLKNNLRKMIKNTKLQRDIIMAMVRLLALLFIIYKAFDIGYSKHILVDNPEKPNRCAAAAAEQSGGRGSKSGAARRAAPSFTKTRAKADALTNKFYNVAGKTNDMAERAVARAGNTDAALLAKDALRSERGANIRNSGAAMLGVKDDDGTFLSKFINLMNSALEFCGNMASTEFEGSKWMIIPKAVKVLIGVVGCMVGYPIYFAILVVALLLSILMKIGKYLFISLPLQIKQMTTDCDQRNILYNSFMTLIKLIPFIVVYNVVGLWFAPIYGLAACIAFAIFVQIKFISFTLFGTKDSQFIKKHIKENRFGLTLLASIMITFSSAKNLKPGTAFGVALASVISMLILACEV